jgi:HSP20 family protein
MNGLLARWHPLRELNSLLRQLDRTLSQLRQGEAFDLLPQGDDAAWYPAIELQETETALILKATVPGMNAQDLDVQVSENWVAIAGNYQEEKTAEGTDFLHSEFQYGQFQRRIPLPVAIEPEQVQATCQDGLLTLTLPKAAPERQHIVKVNVQEQAREAMAADRRHEEHLRETMRTRTAEEMMTDKPNDIAAAARETMVEERQAEEHLKETMHERAAAQVGAAESSTHH